MTLRTLGSALFIAIATLLGACSSGSPSRSELKAGVFEGEWYGHGVGLAIDAHGKGSAHWRTYNVCGQDPAPCDTFQGNTIIDGGRATFLITSVEGTTATGRVSASNDPTFKVGPVRLVYQRSLDMVKITPPVGGHYELCGPRAEAGACGA